jgi:hypothetical protein
MPQIPLDHASLDQQQHMFLLHLTYIPISFLKHMDCSILTSKAIATLVLIICFLTFTQPENVSLIGDRALSGMVVNKVKLHLTEPSSNQQHPNNGWMF